MWPSSEQSVGGGPVYKVLLELETLLFDGPLATGAGEGSVAKHGSNWVPWGLSQTHSASGKFCCEVNPGDVPHQVGERYPQIYKAPGDDEMWILILCLLWARESSIAGAQPHLNRRTECDL